MLIKLLRQLIIIFKIIFEVFVDPRGGSGSTRNGNGDERNFGDMGQEVRDYFSPDTLHCYP